MPTSFVNISLGVRKRHLSIYACVFEHLRLLCFFFVNAASEHSVFCIQHSAMALFLSSNFDTQLPSRFPSKTCLSLRILTIYVPHSKGKQFPNAFWQSVYHLARAYCSLTTFDNLPWRLLTICAPHSKGILSVGNQQFAAHSFLFFSAIQYRQWTTTNGWCLTRWWGDRWGHLRVKTKSPLNLS